VRKLEILAQCATQATPAADLSGTKDKQLLLHLQEQQRNGVFFLTDLRVVAQLQNLLATFLIS